MKKTWLGLDNSKLTGTHLGYVKKKNDLLLNFSARTRNISRSGEHIQLSNGGEPLLYFCRDKTFKRLTSGVYGPVYEYMCILNCEIMKNPK